MGGAKVQAPVDAYVSVRDLRFHYAESGDPGAPPVVWLHGMMGNCREWDTSIARLAPAYRVLALDQRGHGRTSWAAQYTASALADDVIAVVEQLELAPVILVGHSMGGMAAMVAAAMRPDIADRVVIIDIGPESLAGEFAEMLPNILLERARATYGDIEEAVAEWMAGDPLAREDLMRHYVEHCVVERPGGRLAWSYDAAGLATFGADPALLWDAVDSVAAPVLLVRGEYSPLLTAEHAAEMVSRFRDARLVEIADGAHDLGVEQPEAVGAAILDFLAAAEFLPNRAATHVNRVTER